MQGRSETGRSCGGGSTVNPRHRSRIARSHRSRPRHSGSIFRAIGVRPSQTGTTPVEFVKRRRLREALLLLQRSDLINLFVAEAPLGVPMAEVRRVLAPRGVALVRTGDTWEKTVKAWPQELDEWTHWLHGADGNPVGRDTRVGPPRSVQWIASPLWSKSHDANPSLVAMVSAGGRVFYIADAFDHDILVPQLVQSVNGGGLPDAKHPVAGVQAQGETAIAGADHVQPPSHAHTAWRWGLLDQTPRFESNIRRYRNRTGH